MRAGRATALILCLAVPAAAQTPVPGSAPEAVPEAAGAAAAGAYDPTLVETCLTLRGPIQDRSGCIGLGAAHCLGDTPVIEPARAAECRSREAEQWSARLDAALTLLREAAARSDAAAGAAGGMVAALESAQTAWAAWARAECGWRQSLAGGAEIAALDCRLRETALRALALERLRAEGEGP